jgi:hypothetical protein
MLSASEEEKDHTGMLADGLIWHFWQTQAYLSEGVGLAKFLRAGFKMDVNSPE